MSQSERPQAISRKALALPSIPRFASRSDDLGAHPLGSARLNHGDRNGACASADAPARSVVESTTVRQSRSQQVGSDLKSSFRRPMSSPKDVEVKSNKIVGLLSTRLAGESQGHGSDVKPTKSRRHKLHLLNPVTLLRRRGNGPQSMDVGRGLNASTTRLPDDFDPRIRGTGVHDFSSPRPRTALPKYGGQVASHVPWKTENHQASSHVARDTCCNSISDSARPPVPRIQLSEPSGMPGEPKGQVDSDVHAVSTFDPTRSRFPEEVLHRAIEDHDHEQRRSDDIHASLGPLPRHMRSTATRFSFDMEGVGSAAEELLLEEKHRQLTESKSSKSQSGRPQDDLDGSDASEVDDGSMLEPWLDDPGMYEEEVPEVDVDDLGPPEAELDADGTKINGDGPSKGPGSSQTSPEVSPVSGPPAWNGYLPQPLGGYAEQDIESPSPIEEMADLESMPDANSRPNFSRRLDQSGTDGSYMDRNNPLPLSASPTGLPAGGAPPTSSVPLPGAPRIQLELIIPPSTGFRTFELESGGASSVEEARMYRWHENESSLSISVTDGVDEDDDLAVDDDPIIAAANAEILASDAEGFYGQEFGFYPSANGASEDAPALGGYFGPHGFNASTKSHSGNAAFHEPNLTPITERSEYSTRNSFSWPHYSAAQSVHSLPSPGLVQLAGVLEDSATQDDLSLASLQKLRRDAWGGSNGSLRSANGVGIHHHAYSTSNLFLPATIGMHFTSAQAALESSPTRTTEDLSDYGDDDDDDDDDGDEQDDEQSSDGSAPPSPTITQSAFASAEADGAVHGNAIAL